MSAAPDSKFQDHYEVLGLPPQSDTETIQQAYQRLVKQYHPDTGFEPDPEKFDAANLAYEVLSDPELRQQFDKLKGIEQGPPKFSGMSFFRELGDDARLRKAVLCVLFDRRRENPFKPTLTIRQMEKMLTSTSDELNLALWYLRQRGLVLVDDKSTMQITVDGLDALEADPPPAGEVMPLLKPAFLKYEAEANGPFEVARPAAAVNSMPAAPQLQEVPAPVPVTQPTRQPAASVPLGTSGLQAASVEEISAQLVASQVDLLNLADAAGLPEAPVAGVAHGNNNGQPALLPSSGTPRFALGSREPGEREGASVSPEQAKNVAGRLFRILAPGGAPSGAASNGKPAIGLPPDSGSGVKKPAPQLEAWDEVTPVNK